MYSLHTFGNGAVADGEKRINNDGRNIKLNIISNIIKVSATANAIKNPMDGPMTKFYVDNWITALRGSVVRRVFGTHERIVFGSEHGEYSNTINFRFIEYVSESSRP